jgi:hypothetical protein
MMEGSGSAPLIQIREAQTLKDPTDPDPEHCTKNEKFHRHIKKILQLRVMLSFLRIRLRLS